MVATAIRPRSPPWLRCFALAGLGYILSFAITNEWNPWIGRVLMPGVALAAPLLAGAALRPWLAGAVLALAAIGLVPSVLMNPQKPLLVERKVKNVFRLDRLTQQTLVRTEMLPVIAEVNARIDDTGSLGFVGNEDSWDYPLFGQHRERRVVRLKPEEVNRPIMAIEGLDGVLFANVAPPPTPLVSYQIADLHARTTALT